MGERLSPAPVGQAAGQLSPGDLGRQGPWLQAQPPCLHSGNLMGHCHLSPRSSTELLLTYSGVRGPGPSYIGDRCWEKQGACLEDSRDLPLSSAHRQE